MDAGWVDSENLRQSVIALWVVVGVDGGEGYSLVLAPPMKGFGKGANLVDQLSFPFLADPHLGTHTEVVVPIHYYSPCRG